LSSDPSDPTPLRLHPPLLPELLDHLHQLRIRERLPPVRLLGAPVLEGEVGTGAVELRRLLLHQVHRQLQVVVVHVPGVHVHLPRQLRPDARPVLLEVEREVEVVAPMGGHLLVDRPRAAVLRRTAPHASATLSSDGADVLRDSAYEGA
jgi:hypothetical protein